MRRIGEYASDVRAKLAMILGLAALLAAVTVATQDRPAEAAFSDPCTDTQKNQIIRGFTGETPIGFACYDSTFGIKSSDSYATKQSKISPFINACGTTISDRNLAQAVVERTGNMPNATPPSGVCNKAVYEQRVRSSYTGGGTPPTVDWTKLRSSAYPNSNVDNAVHITMNMCGITNISMAIIEVTGQLPKRGGDLEDPGQLGSKYFAGNGQCESTLYNHGQTSYGGYEMVKKFVKARAQSTRQCGDPLITDAYRSMTGWNPVPADPSSLTEFDECNIYRYNNGQWTTRDELKNYVYHSWRCENNWIGQIYAKDFGRKAYGRGDTGECNWHLYGDYSAGSFEPGSFQEVRKRISGVQTAMSNKGWTFGQGGGGDIRTVSGGFTPGESVLFESADGVIASGAGNVIANGAGNVIANGAGNLITLPHGGVIASGAGNVIANGAGNLKASKGGGSILSSYGG